MEHDTPEHTPIDHEAIRTGAIPWSADELDIVLAQSRGGEESLHVAAARFRELGLDTATSLAHGMRLFAIIDFLHDHHDRLYECGLLLPSDTERNVISLHVLDLLATSPFTEPTGEISISGKPHLTFDADDIIIEAGRRQKADDEQHDS